MKTEQKGNVIPIIAGVAFLLLALNQLRYFQPGIPFILLLDFAAYAALAVLLFMKNRTMLLSIPIAIMVLLNIRVLFSNLRYLEDIGGIRILIMLINILATLSLLLLASIALIDSLSQYQDKTKQLSFLPTVVNTLMKYKEKAKQFWFLPFCLAVVSGLLGLVSGLWILFQYGENYINFFITLLSIASYALISMWLAYPDGFPTESHHTSGGTNANGQVMGNAYCDLVKHILLLLFTFGIYYLIWIYRATAYLNCVEDEPPRNPTNKLLLCMFVPFYSIYWTYKSAQRIDRLAVSKGVASDITTLCIILAFFVGIIPPILMQEKMNTIASVENETVTPQAHNATMTATPRANIGAAEELKTYKGLLDSGVITQDEFDAKKKQLLGL